MLLVQIAHKRITLCFDVTSIPRYNTDVKKYPQSKKKKPKKKPKTHFWSSKLCIIDSQPTLQRVANVF